MSSIGTIFSTARSAIAAHQTAVQIASTNIANAHTEGYTRKRIGLAEAYPIRDTFGSRGHGVMVTTIGRTRDAFLDAAFRRESGNAAHFGMRHDLLVQVESVFGEPSDSGLAATLDAFWSSWSDLANNPTSATARGVVQQRGLQVATTFRSFAQRLDQLAESTRHRLSEQVHEINRQAERIAVLNEQIVAVESGGGVATDLRDDRDRALDVLARVAPAQVHERRDGSISVSMAGHTLVDGVHSKRVEVRSGPPVGVGIVGGSGTMHGLEGSLGATLQVLTEDLQGARLRLDALADALVDGINGIHLTGTVQQGGAWVQAGEFFTKGGAAGIDLDPLVRADASTIASGAGGASGDNSVALEMAALRHKQGMVGDISFADFYTNLVTDVALRVDSASSSTRLYETLSAEADLRRESVSGVSIDEELIRLMNHQQSYVAATRLVSAADEMMKSILNMV
jgi:flagellar hook-associated protein 1